ncbi:hypothetical protein [Fusobacterium sp.]|uniref:hypothetical protein n=1 Tax=Fusobacterium sp. TaxID=68766 RepID=UPI002637A064|nr:hypothetical protein [Fusobacterium sp.]
MKIKNLKFLFCVLISVFFIGCSALDSLLPKTSTEEISLVNKGEGRYIFKVNYDKQYTKNVYLDNVKIEPGVPYFVQEGKYWFRFDNIEKYRISMMFSGSRGVDKDDFDPPQDRSYQFVKRVTVNEDKIIDIQGRKCKINFQVGKGF